MQGMKTAGFAEAVVVDRSQIVALPADLPLDAGVPARLRRHHRGRRRGQRRAAAARRDGGGDRRRRRRAQHHPGRGASPARRDRRHRRRSRPSSRPRAASAPPTASLAGPDAARSGPGARRRPRRRLRLRHRRRPRGDRRRPTCSPPAARWSSSASPPNGVTVAYEPTRLASLNQSIVGARMGRTVLARDIPWLIQHWRAGRLKLAELISRRYPLERINEAFAATSSGADRRNVIVFGDAHEARRPRGPRRRQPAARLRRPLLHLRQAHHRRRHQRLGRGLRRHRRPRGDARGDRRRLRPPHGGRKPARTSS